MTNEQLIAILAATRTDALYTETGAEVDWSTTDEHGRRVFEISPEANDDSEPLTLRMTRTEVETLVQRLAATLLATAD